VEAALLLLRQVNVWLRWEVILEALFASLLLSAGLLG
jgi:hypothetical protein